MERRAEGIPARRVPKKLFEHGNESQFFALARGVSDPGRPEDVQEQLGPEKPPHFAGRLGGQRVHSPDQRGQQAEEAGVWKYQQILVGFDSSHQNAKQGIQYNSFN